MQTPSAPPPVMNAGDASPSEGCCHEQLATRPKPGHDKRSDKGVFGAWHTKRSVLFELNEMHGGFRRIFFDHFRALLEETNDEAYVGRLADYVRWILSKYMFVRVERPRGSRHFVLGYVKCDRVFSFARRFKQMRVRLNRVPPTLLAKVEVDENKALRLACVGETDYERALALHSDGGSHRSLRFAPHTGWNNVLLTPLLAALEAKDEESAEALLDGGDDPNEVDGDGMNALHVAAWKGCRLPLFHRMLGMIHNVNAGDKCGWTALMWAASNNHLDMVTALMNHPGIDVNVQNRYKFTALHRAVSGNHPAIVAQFLRDDRIDCSLKDKYNKTPLKLAIFRRHDECARILREHCTPLGAALEVEDEESAEALLDGGDDPNDVDREGRNALHMAAREGCRPPLFHRILGMIQNVNAVDKYGDTALMWAAIYNHLDMVTALMNHPGIDVNVQEGYYNRTALHCAVDNNHPAIVAQLLSDDKIDCSLKDYGNDTPLRVAIVCARDECAKILREHGAPED